jgi:MMP 1-O-methyltransferase
MSSKTSIKRRLAGFVHLFPPLARLIYRLRYGKFGPYLADAFPIPSWLGLNESLVLAEACHELPANAAIVEIGSFLGKSAIIMAGARKLRGSGIVHCVDPFDASGDAFSIPAYKAIADSHRLSLRQRFESHIAQAGLSDWVQVHQGTAASIAAGWTEPIDMLFMDGDQSPEGVDLAYESWAPFLKVGGIIALHNSSERAYDPGHDGHRRLLFRRVHSPQYGELRCVDTTTLARKLMPSPSGTPDGMVRTNNL